MLKAAGDWLLTKPRVTRTRTWPEAAAAGTTQSRLRAVPATLFAMDWYVVPLSTEYSTVKGRELSAASQRSTSVSPGTKPSPPKG